MNHHQFSKPIKSDGNATLKSNPKSPSGAELRVAPGFLLDFSDRQIMRLAPRKHFEISSYERNIMNRRQPAIGMLLLLNLVMAFCAVAQETTFTQAQLDLLASASEEFINSYNGNMQLQLHIVTEKGIPISSVSLNIDQSKMTSIGFVYDYFKNIADGEFRFSGDSIAGIYLRFYKQGYYSAQRSYVYRHPNASVIITSNGQLYSETVVLKRIGPTGKIRGPIEIKIIYSPETSGSVTLFDVFANFGALDIDKIPLLEPRIINDVTSPDLVATPSIYLTITPSSQSVAPIVNPGKNDPNSLITPKDGYLQLVMNDPSTTAGFTIIQNTQDWETEDMLDAKEAPDSSYDHRITITTTTLVNPTKVFFYFHMNGIYGKGCITSAKYKYWPARHWNKAEVWVTLWFQLDGSRNVTSK